MQTTAEVVKLDKSLPLIQTADGFKTRAEFCATLSKKHASVAIGDVVGVSFDNETLGIRDQGLGISRDLGVRDDLGNRDQGLGISSMLDCPCIIEEVCPRRSILVRNDPVNRRKEQVLAANFDQIAICVVAGEENFNHLARMLAIACNSEVPITLIFTKCDLGEANLGAVRDLSNANDKMICTGLQGIRDEGLGISGGETRLPLETRSFVARCAPQDDVWGVQGETSGDASQDDVWGVQDDIMGDGPFADWRGKTTVLLGKSGAGKSTLINALAGKEVCKQGEVRQFDSKGRHTTVSREIIETENFGRIVDMPGVRSLGLINCEAGLEKVFSEIYDFSQKCKFRDCQHTSEPGCAVKGNVSDQLLCAFHELSEENAANTAVSSK